MGRYLGSTDPEVGSGLLAMILFDNGQVVNRNTLRNLTIQELSDDNTRREREIFIQRVADKLGQHAMDTELEEKFGISAVTPIYEAY